MDRKSVKDPIQMLDFIETIDLPADANSVDTIEHVLRKDKSNILRRALDFKGRGSRKMG